MNKRYSGIAQCCCIVNCMSHKSMMVCQKFPCTSIALAKNTLLVTLKGRRPVCASFENINGADKFSLVQKLVC